MSRSEADFASLKDAIRTASSKRFGILRSKFELLPFALLAVSVAGVICLAARTQPLATQLTAMASAVACMLFVLSAYRLAVPFMLQLSYADMLRIRRPFYVWLCCAFLVVCLSSPLLSLFSAPCAATLHVALVIVSVALALGYFRDGSPWHLFASAAFAGGAVGLSAFGLCAPVFALLLSFLMRRKLYEDFEDGNWSTDVVTKRVLKRMGNPSAKTLTRMVVGVCFLLGVAAPLAERWLTGAEPLSEFFSREWLPGLSKGGVIVLAALGAVPLLIASNGIGKASDTMLACEAGTQTRYITVSLLSFVFLLLNADIVSKVGIPVSPDPRYWLLGMVFAGFALLLSASVAIVDVWCRLPLMARRRGMQEDGSTLWLCRFLLLSVPVVFVLVVFCVRFWGVLKELLGLGA